MVTPGPVVITVAFIGYLVRGFSGAALAALGVFLPCYLFVIVPAPFYARFAGNPGLRSFVGGVTAAATGAIAGAVWVLARRAIVDLPTVVIFAGTLACVTWWKRVPEPVVIVVVGLATIAWRAPERMPGTWVGREARKQTALFGTARPTRVPRVRSG